MRFKFDFLFYFPTLARQLQRITGTMPTNHRCQSVSLSPPPAHASHQSVTPPGPAAARPAAEVLPQQGKESASPCTTNQPNSLPTLVDSGAVGVEEFASVMYRGSTNTLTYVPQLVTPVVYFLDC